MPEHDVMGEAMRCDARRGEDGAGLREVRVWETGT